MTLLWQAMHRVHDLEQKNNNILGECSKQMARISVNYRTNYSRELPVPSHMLQWLLETTLVQLSKTMCTAKLPIFWCFKRL
jgi:hypothetical protein